MRNQRRLRHNVHAFDAEWISTKKKRILVDSQTVNSGQLVGVGTARANLGCLGEAPGALLPELGVNWRSRDGCLRNSHISARIFEVKLEVNSFSRFNRQ